MLSTEQLLSLAIMSYALDRDFAPYRGMSLRAIVDETDRSLKWRMSDTHANMSTVYHEQMNYIAWFAVLDAVRADERLCALELASFAHDERDAKLLCFTEKTDAGTTDAYVVYAGTGAGEWPDNCVAGYASDSEQQLRALVWTRDKVLGQGYDRIFTTGHSKGGNKALYVAVRLGDAVERAVSFDGQGFSLAFLERYRDQIVNVAPRLESYVSENDYVNGLLNAIVYPENLHVIEAPSVSQAVENHAPSLLFATPDRKNPRLTLAPEIEERGDLGRLQVTLTQYIQNTLDDGDLVRFCTFLGEALENMFSSKLSVEQRRDSFVRLVTSEDFALVASKLIGFFQSIGQSVNLTDIISFFAPPNEASRAEVGPLSQRLRDRIPGPSDKKDAPDTGNKE